MRFSSGAIKIFFVAALLFTLWRSAAAQDDSHKDPPDIPTNPRAGEICEKTGNSVMDEMRMKMCIKQQEKEYRGLLDNGEEAVKLSGELEKTYESSQALSADDEKKVERLEKLFKKIRSSLGGEDDEPGADEEKPTALSAAVQKLNEKAAGLLDELKKSTRYSISVTAIQTSNMMIRLLRYIRGGKN